MRCHRFHRPTTLMFVPLVCLLISVSLAHAATTKPPIADAVIDPDRSRVPEGKVTIASHVTLSPKWLNPQVPPINLGFLQKLHDFMIRVTPGHVFTYSLAEFYDMSPDFKMVTVRLREGPKFHNSEPVTAEDVKFSYENYHGMNAAFLHDKTERVEVVDDRTVRFHFKEPFLDFLLYSGTTASSAGMIIPKNYYLSLGSTTQERDEKFA